MKDVTKTLWRSALLLTASLALTLGAAAQNTGDGSIYSRFGLGEPRSYPSSQVQAMGGAATALRSFNYVNFANPATWSDQVLVHAAVGLLYQGVVATDASDQTSRLNAGSFQAFQFSFPILQQKLGAAVGFMPYSRVNYRVQQPDDFTTGGTDDTTAVAVRFEGTGGLQQIVGGLGYRLNDNLSVGASVDVVFGIIENQRRTNFLSGDYIDTNLSTVTQLVGVTGTFGALLSVDGLLGEQDGLMAGARVTLPTKLSSERVQTLGESLDRDTVSTRFEGTTELPLSAAFGLSYHPDARWLLAADVLYEPWSSFDSDLPYPGFTPGAENFFQDRIRTSAGLEFLPAGDDLIASYLERVGYRIGFYYDQAYVVPLAGADLRTLAVTGGLSLPTLLSGTRIDLNVEVGTRGSTDQELVRDLFYRISANVNIGERWFVKRKLR